MHGKRRVPYVFVILQQILLIDLAYWANDSLVAIAEEDVDLWCGYPSPLVALLVGALILYVAAIVGIGVLFMRLTNLSWLGWGTNVSRGRVAPTY